MLAWWTSPRGEYDPGDSGYGRNKWTTSCNLPIYMDCECTAKSPEVILANMIMDSDITTQHSIEEYCRDYQYDLVPDIEALALVS